MDMCLYDVIVGWSDVTRLFNVLYRFISLDKADSALDSCTNIARTRWMNS